MILENPIDFINNSSVGIHTVNAQGVIEYANQCELEVLGYERHEYVGHHVSEFQLDCAVLDDMLKRLGDFEILKNYPSIIKGKNRKIYMLYNSSVFSRDNQFIHTRCFGNEIEEPAYKLFLKSLKL